MIELNDNYKPLFYNKDKRYHLVTGGRGSGKSFSIVLFLILLLEQENEVILFTRYTLTSAHISIIPEFLNMIDLLGWGDKFHVTKNEVINKGTGSRILFRGIKTSSGTQTANLKSISGVTCWVLDEAEELVDEKVFSKIDLSIRTKNKQNRVILIMNPTTRDHFIYKKWFEGGPLDSTVYIHTTYKDNKKNLSESLVQEIEKIQQSDPKRYQNEILGGWILKAEGLMYSDFKTWESLPQFKIIKSYTDTADEGKDYLCSIVYGVPVNNENENIYILDVVFNNKGMETTEPLVAQMFEHNDCRINMIESNNGGRGFARAVEKLIPKRLKVKWFHQSKNKKARIFSNSASVNSSVVMPEGWHIRHKDFYDSITHHLKDGSSKHDDGPDCLTGCYEQEFSKKELFIY